MLPLAHTSLFNPHNTPAYSFHKCLFSFTVYWTMETPERPSEMCAQKAPYKAVRAAMGSQMECLTWLGRTWEDFPGEEAAGLRLDGQGRAHRAQQRDLHV